MLHTNIVIFYTSPLYLAEDENRDKEEDTKEILIF